MGAGRTVTLVPLACPACGSALDPLGEDRVFACAACGTGTELRGANLERREVRFAGPKPEPPVVYLPFWRLGEGAIVPAFNGSRLLTIAAWYSGRDVALAGEHEPARRALWGGSIGLEDAVRIHRLRTDAPAPGDAPSLIAVPFRPEPSRVICMRTGLHIYRETLDGAGAIIDRWIR